MCKNRAGCLKNFLGGGPLFGVPSILKDLKSEVFSLGHSIFPEESANFLTGDEIWPLGNLGPGWREWLGSHHVYLISILPVCLYPYSLLCLVPKAHSSSSSFLQRVHTPALPG